MEIKNDVQLFKPEESLIRDIRTFLNKTTFGTDRIKKITVTKGLYTKIALEVLDHAKKHDKEPYPLGRLFVYGIEIEEESK
jgi:hypothetical protein